MTYELIQAGLTNLITFTAIAGITGIAVHAFYTRHTRWMRTYCPPLADYTPDTREEALAPAQTEETMTPFSEISQLTKALVTEAMPATDAALEALKEVVEEVQPPTLAEDLGLVPPSDWGKVQQPAVRKPRIRKPATTKTRTRTTKKAS